MFALELESQEEELDKIVQEDLIRLLLPQTSTDSLPAVLSLNVGIGGGEAARFLEELSKMYKVYAETRGWDIEVLSAVEGPQAKGSGGNGLRETTIKFRPNQHGDVNEFCFGDLMWESGVHRVQRVPPGSTVDKMHSSTVTVNVSTAVHQETFADCSRSRLYTRIHLKSRWWIPRTSNRKRCGREEQEDRQVI